MALRLVLVLLILLQSLSAPTVAKAIDFGTSYFPQGTEIPLNLGNVPTKFVVQPQTSGGGISAILPLGDSQSWPAFYVVRGNILYVTGYIPGYMYFQVHERRVDGFDVVSSPILFTFYQVQLATEADCQGYNRLENFASVSSLKPLRFIVSSWPKVNKLPDMEWALTDQSLGLLQDVSATIKQVTYLRPGKSQLIATLQSSSRSIPLKVISVDFLPVKTVKVNFYHVHDPQGYLAWQLQQAAMIHDLQNTESILNQAGLSVVIGEQKDVYLTSSIGEALDAGAQNISPEEQSVVAAADVESDAVSVFVVWDYRVDNESKVGMHYFFPGKGDVVFLTDRTTKPGETLAHEISHVLGLEHNTLGSSYLMSAQEQSGISQCMYSENEVWALNQSR